MHPWARKISSNWRSINLFQTSNSLLHFETGGGVKGQREAKFRSLYRSRSEPQTYTIIHQMLYLVFT